MNKVIYLNNYKKKGIIMSEERTSKLNLLKYILFFANKSKKNLYKTKLNKLLFYTQFIYYKKYKERLLRDDFICDFYGPAIENIDYYLSEFESKKFIERLNSQFGTIIMPEVVLDDEAYEEKELDVLYAVLNKFDKFTSAQISEYSHKESLWSEKHIKEIIDIERAEELKNI